jgi:hypothetical protein
MDYMDLGLEDVDRTHVTQVRARCRALVNKVR